MSTRNKPTYVRMRGKFMDEPPSACRSSHDLLIQCLCSTKRCWKRMQAETFETLSLFTFRAKSHHLTLLAPNAGYSWDSTARIFRGARGIRYLLSCASRRNRTGYFTAHKYTQFYLWLAWKTPSCLKASISRMRIYPVVLQKVVMECSEHEVMLLVPLRQTLQPLQTGERWRDIQVFLPLLYVSSALPSVF
jgi:hypothetical protein